MRNQIIDLLNDFFLLNVVSDCAVTTGERVTCGHSGISSSECEKMGCCVDSSACYYPLDGKASVFCGIKSLRVNIQDYCH